MPTTFEELERLAGVVFMGENPKWQMTQYAKDYNMAADADPGLVTVSSAGIPSFLTMYQDPKVIEALLAPMSATKAVGAEVKKGDFTTDTAMFQLIEMTGETSSYGDYSDSGAAGANTNFPQRQSYRFQNVAKWGQLELEKAGLAKIDWANRKSLASVNAINRKFNDSYLYGITGLQNYGMTNDPALPTALTPITKAAGGTTWVTSGAVTATPLEIQKDIQKMWYALQVALKGNLQMDDKMTLIMSTAVSVALTATNDFGNSAAKFIKDIFPNMKFEFIPQYSTGSGELVQLVVDEIDGQKAWECAFAEKMRAFPMEIKGSYYQQKRAASTFGTVIYRPVQIQQMLGV